MVVAYLVVVDFRALLVQIAVGKELKRTKRKVISIGNWSAETAVFISFVLTHLIVWVFVSPHEVPL